MHLKLTNGVPAKYTLGQLRRDNTQTSFPKLIPDELLASYDVYPYALLPYAGFNEDTHEFAGETFLQDEAGDWFLRKEIAPLPQEQAEANIRNRRDSLLKDSDWVVIMHTEKGTNIPMEWEVYRQALRDITAQAGFPYSVEWPTKPE